MSKKVFVGLSGGVDSSVTAALLQQQGYDVTGVYMKNWSQDLLGFECPWKEDYQDAKRVAVHLGIDFKMYDFETQYRDLLTRYARGRRKIGHFHEGGDVLGATVGIAGVIERIDSDEDVA